MVGFIVAVMMSAPPCDAEKRCEIGFCANGCRTVLRQNLFPAYPEQLEDLVLVRPQNLVRSDGEPGFGWYWPDGADLVAVGVFRDFPSYTTDNEHISNFTPEIVAWVWHSNLNGGPGAVAVSWNEGRALQEGAVALEPSLDQAQALDAGVYYWGAWGWQGADLRFRSEVRSFFVGVETTTGTRCETQSDCIGLTSAQCVDEVCVLTCASEDDCYQGETCDLSTASQRGFGICRFESPCARGTCAQGQTCREGIGLCQHERPVRRSGCASAASPAGLGLVALCLPLLRRRRAP